MAIPSKVFDRARAHDVYESIAMLYGMLAIALWILIGVAMYFDEWKSFYWAASIVSNIFVMLMTALTLYLYRNVLMVDNVNTPDFLKMMRYHNILSGITAGICVVGLVTSGWLGFTWGDNDIHNGDTTTIATSISTSKDMADAAKEAAEKASNIKEGNGQISGAILGLNTLGVILMVMCLWANYKFKQYLRKQESFMSPEQYEQHVINSL